MNPTTATMATVPNFIGGELGESNSARRLPVTNPNTGEAFAETPLSTAEELDAAVKAAAEAQRAWGAQPLKDRVQVHFRLKALLEENIDALAEVIVEENGKTAGEARGSIARAVECVEFATSLPQIATGSLLEVSRGVECRLMRYPLGVVAGITPFNFPLMVPLWMIPLALGLGNAFILKPSEQTPLSAIELAKLFKQAGLPAGVFSVVNGDREIVEAICDHPEIQAVGFVGSTRVAKLVHTRAAASGKRVRALGGAKNHLIVVPDAHPEMTVANVVASATGCAGQRCMAASVLLAVGEVDHIVDKIKERMAALVPGRDIGGVISKAARERIAGYLDRAPETGGNVAVDGRKKEVSGEGGYFIGASVIEVDEPGHEAACNEIFGPTLTIIRCKTLDEALAIENANPHGNAAAIYTSSGRVAAYFTDRAGAGMVGVNIGVPVPREPFPFGGWNDSSFGDGDLTGPDAIDFWSKSKKVTTKWSEESQANWMS